MTAIQGYNESDSLNLNDKIADCSTISVNTGPVKLSSFDFLSEKFHNSPQFQEKVLDRAQNLMCFCVFM